MKALPLVAALLMLSPTVVSLPLGDPPVEPGEPVLAEGSPWVRESWGYRHASLALPAEGDWPVVLTMEGYAGASRPAPNAYLRMDDGELMALRLAFGAGPRGDYAFAQASIRGTECSGGQFNLYDRRHAWDGHHIVEWLGAQPWSNGKVGMYGNSFPGQTAYWVATTQPKHLAAVMPSLLHSDIYRDIFMPGGVQNYVFPVLWTYATGPHRLPQDSLENGVVQEDEICRWNQASRYGAGEPPVASQEPIFKAVESTDNDWYAAHAALTYAGLIKIPYYQQNNWQDEQTGPRAAVLWHHVHPTPRIVKGCDGEWKLVEPKKMVLSSGGHGHGGFAGRDRWAWFDIWLLGMPDRECLLEDRVVNHFETRGDGSATTVKRGDHWPFEDTRWTTYTLHGDGAMDLAPRAPGEPTQTYHSGVGRQSHFFYAPESGMGSDATMASGHPDAVTWETAPLAEDVVIAGPIVADIKASMVGTDANFFVSIADVWPDGSVSLVQRGLLKASHRAIDPLRSYYDDGLMVQPYRPHTNPQPVVPGEVVDYKIEVFPVGHVFRAGHQIRVQLHTPPALDHLWGYTPTQHPQALVTVHDASILLPVVEPDAPLGPAPEGCQVPDGFPCYRKPLLDAPE